MACSVLLGPRGKQEVPVLKRPVMEPQMRFLKKGRENTAVVTGAECYTWRLFQVCLVELNFLLMDEIPFRVVQNEHTAVIFILPQRLLTVGPKAKEFILLYGS